MRDVRCYRMLVSRVFSLKSVHSRYDIPPLTSSLAIRGTSTARLPLRWPILLRDTRDTRGLLARQQFNAVRLDIQTNLDKRPPEDRRRETGAGLSSRASRRHARQRDQPLAEFAGVLEHQACVDAACGWGVV